MGCAGSKQPEFKDISIWELAEDAELKVFVTDCIAMSNVKITVPVRDESGDETKNETREFKDAESGKTLFKLDSKVSGRKPSGPQQASRARDHMYMYHMYRWSHDHMYRIYN